MKPAKQETGRTRQGEKGWMEPSTSMRFRDDREQVKKSVEKGNADARVKLES